MNKTVLAIDIGTSSLKAALIDISGAVIADTRCRFPRTKRKAEDWIDAFREALCVLTPGADIAALIISGNGPTLVSVAPEGKTGALLLWNDPVEQSPIKNSSNSLFIPRIIAFRNQFPKHYSTARWIFSGPEYLIYCLTGNPLTILPEERFINAYWTDVALREAEIDNTKLPPFVLPGTHIGTTSGTFFPELKSGIPVITGGPDFIVAIIGTGTLEEGKACDRAGTSEGLNICTVQKVSHPQIRTLPSVIAPFWNASFLLPQTGALFHCYRKSSGQAMRSYPEIMSEIQASPIFPLNGEPLHPGRAIVEQIGFSVRTGIEVLKKATGISPLFALSGGQARNDIWNQLKADITGSAFALTSTPDGELMGNAILGFTALGEYASIREAAQTMVRVSRIYEPDPIKRIQYDEKYTHYENL